MGAVTAAAGGMLRDVLCGDVPMILHGRELYATAAVAGILTTLVLRTLSLRRGIGLPAYELLEDAGGADR
jgi:uncharacterized membrane protein YeiH